jgi:regulator of cell morphogenesis and NO signaling
MQTLSANVRISDVVRENPGRTRVLEQYGIEYCCSAGRTIADACAAKHLSADVVLSALSDYDRTTDLDVVDWNRAPLGKLIDHILDDHHEYLREELPRIEAMFQKLIAAHGGKYPEIVTCADVFVDLRYELECHMMKEEQALFPAIRRLEGRQPGDPMGPHTIGIGEPVAVMEHEHTRAGRALEEMHRATHGYTAPPQACATHRALLEALARLERDLHEHISEENNILFPRAMELGDDAYEGEAAD